MLPSVGLVVIGLALLVFGGELLVRGAVRMALAHGVSTLVVGLTIVAFGTSAPELAVSLQAVRAGAGDLALGNVLGSNIFNILSVLGLVAPIAPGGVPVSPVALRFDVPVMIATSSVCLPIFFTGYCISRWEGGLFLAYYAAYTLFLLLASSRHEALTTLVPALGYFALPLTAVTLGILSFRQIRARTKPRP